MQRSHRAAGSRRETPGPAAAEQAGQLCGQEGVLQGPGSYNVNVHLPKRVLLITFESSVFEIFNKEHCNIFLLQVKENGFVLGCGHCRLDLYTRNQLEHCREKHVAPDEVPQRDTTVREAAGPHWRGGSGVSQMYKTVLRSLKVYPAQYQM